MQKLHFVFMDGREEDREIGDPSELFTLLAGEIPAGVKYIDVMPDRFTAETGDQGFMLIPNVANPHSGHSALTRFRPREDCEEIFTESSMPVYACCRNGAGELAIVTGMEFEYALVVGVKDGRYYLFPRFGLDGRRPYEIGRASCRERV